MIELHQDTSTIRFEKLTWRPGEFHTLVACASGHIASLTDHMIDATGIVAPSLICPTEGCGWHENIRLVGWQG